MTDIEVHFPKIFQPLDLPNRYKVMRGGRGSAKSWTTARKLLIRGLEKPMRILCTRELQKSIKQSVHKLLTLQIQRMGLQGHYDATDNVIRGINGTEFLFMGLRHNTDEIKSTEAIDICWIEEGHSITQNSWELIDPTIRQEKSEIWVTYNPRFKFDHIHQTFVVNRPPPGSWVQEINHTDNPYFPEVLRTQMEHMKEVDYENYLHVWEGKIKKLADGAIFAKQVSAVHREGRRVYIPIQDNCEVHTFWDIGKSDLTSIWFMQQVGMEYRFFDYYQASQEEVSHYCKIIKGNDYLYGKHHLPHDADHDRLGMERNIAEQLEDGGVHPQVIVPRIGHKSTAIEQTREAFPNCWFHEGTIEEQYQDNINEHGKPCADGMETRARRVERGYDALCNYRYRFKEEDNTFELKPHHDWSSNPADALMQFAQGYDNTPHRTRVVNRVMQGKRSTGPNRKRRRA